MGQPSHGHRASRPCRHAGPRARRTGAQLALRVRLGPGALDVLADDGGQRPPRPPAQQRVLHPQPVADPGVARVEHDARLAAGREHAQRLADRLSGIRRVVQDAPRIDALERAVGERQALGVGLQDPASSPSSSTRRRTSATACSVRSTPVAIAPARTKRMKSVPTPTPISSSRLRRAPAKSA